MNSLRQIRRLAFVGIAIAVVLSVWGAAPATPDERDRQVLEALLTHLLSDSKFDVTSVPPTNGTIVILNVCNPDKTGFLSEVQIHSETRDQALPEDAENDMRRRNTPSDVRPGTYDSASVSYTNFTFASPIVVTDLTEMRGNEFSFKKKYPKARGWLNAYLPGYSANGNVAVVRAEVGPWVHGAMLTAVLEKNGDKWVVKWYHIARYA